MASVIRGSDNFDSTPPSFGRVLRTAGNLSTTSTTAVDVTGASITITTGANPVAYGTTQTSGNNTLSEYHYFNVLVDGVKQHGSSGTLHSQSVASYPYNTSFSGLTAPLTAGSHTLKLTFHTNVGTLTLRGTSTHSHLFYAYEVK